MDNNLSNPSSSRTSLSSDDDNESTCDSEMSSEISSNSSTSASAPLSPMRDGSTFSAGNSDSTTSLCSSSQCSSDSSFSMPSVTLKATKQCLNLANKSYSIGSSTSSMEEDNDDPLSNYEVFSTKSAEDIEDIPRHQRITEGSTTSEQITLNRSMSSPQLRGFIFNSFVNEQKQKKLASLNANNSDLPIFYPRHASTQNIGASSRHEPTVEFSSSTGNLCESTDGILPMDIDEVPRSSEIQGYARLGHMETNQEHNNGTSTNASTDDSKKRSHRFDIAGQEENEQGRCKRPRYNKDGFFEGDYQ